MGLHNTQNRDPLIGNERKTYRFVKPDHEGGGQALAGKPGDTPVKAAGDVDAQLQANSDRTIDAYFRGTIHNKGGKSYSRGIRIVMETALKGDKKVRRECVRVCVSHSPSSGCV